MMSLVDIIEAFKRGDITAEDCVLQMGKETDSNLSALVKGLPGLPYDKSLELIGAAYHYDKGTKSFDDDYDRVRHHTAIKKLFDSYKKGEFSEAGFILAVAKDNVAQSVGLSDTKTLVDFLRRELTDKQASALQRALTDYDIASQLRKELEKSDAPSLLPVDNEETYALCAALRDVADVHGLSDNIGLTRLARLLTKTGVLDIANIGAVSAFERGASTAIEQVYREADSVATFARLIAERWSELRDEPTVKAAYLHTPPILPWGKSYCRTVYYAITARLHIEDSKPKKQ